LIERRYAHMMRIQEAKMKAAYDVGARKRPVNVTLNEDLVSRVRRLTDNLSSVVESLLADFLVEQAQRRSREAESVKRTIATWNRFAERHGSYADEHSTL
jgi:antitoxin CcdA